MAGGKNTKSIFKENARAFSKNSSTQEIGAQDWKKTTKIIQKRKLQTRNESKSWNLVRWTALIRKQTSKSW